MANPLNKRVQFPRNTTQKNDNYTGPSGQVVVDVERREMRLHDGMKKGGWRFPNLDQLKRLFLTRDTEFGQIQFADEQVGVMVRTGNRVYRLRELGGADGITVDNPDGVGGDITIGLPDRVSEQITPLTDANLALDTGWYVIQKGAASNLPAVWLTTNDVFLEVIAYEDTVGGSMIQRARAADISGITTYTRRRIGGVFTAWETTPPSVAPLSGDYTEINDGVRQEKKLWSAQDISELVRQLVQSIQYIDGANAAQAKSFNDLFNQPGVGADSTKMTFGTFTFATNDRFELVASATAKNQPAGDSQFATIEIQRSDLSWDVLSNVNVATAANSGPTSLSTRVRFTKTATGYQLADDNWAAVGGNIAATLSGLFRVSVGALNTIGARGSRWR